MFAIAKIDTQQQMVFGWANVALRKDGSQVEDSQGDIIDLDDLEQAAYHFVLKARAAGVMHKGSAVGTLVESLVCTPAKLQALGLAPDALPSGWWVGFYIPDTQVFSKIKNGTYAMFSIQGVGLREEVGA